MKNINQILQVFFDIKNNQASVPDIIEIKPENPYLRVNYDYIVDRMENEGRVVISHCSGAVRDIGRNILRRGKKYKTSKQREEELWVIMIRLSDDIN